MLIFFHASCLTPSPMTWLYRGRLTPTYTTCLHNSEQPRGYREHECFIMSRIPPWPWLCREVLYYLAQLANVPAFLYADPELIVFFFAFKVGRKTKYTWRIVSCWNEDDKTQSEKKLQWLLVIISWTFSTIIKIKAF